MPTGMSLPSFSSAAISRAEIGQRYRDVMSGGPKRMVARPDSRLATACSRRPVASWADAAEAETIARHVR